ncbi:hypothetical protein GGR55DRAFT_672517 [Xylaria sp. FL0064]|nr:hypothetical protein GGR55DRAFT_672517 [Xylaria sp. FL0064]
MVYGEKGIRESTITSVFKNMSRDMTRQVWSSSMRILMKINMKKYHFRHVRRRGTMGTMANVVDQNRQSIMDSPPAESSYPNLRIANTIHAHLTSPWTNKGLPGFPKSENAAYEGELLEPLEIESVIPTAENSYGSMNVTRNNDGAAKEINVFWGQSEDSPETLPVFNSDTGISEMIYPSERVICFDSTESEGEGFLDDGQLGDVGDPFRGVDFDILEMHVAERQGGILGSGDMEFVGPFTTG